jgi:hypothetical protein
MKLYYKIRDMLFPRQRWLTKKIPKDWCDKPELIKIILFETLVHFVEEENGLSDLKVNWDEDISAGFIRQNAIDHKRNILLRLNEAYSYIKNDRPRLIQKLADDYRISLQDDIDRRDQATLNTIISHQSILWT